MMAMNRFSYAAASTVSEALEVLDRADGPGTIVHSPESWPVPAKEATKAWQPEEPSPVVQVMAPRVREMLRQMRR